MTIKLGCFGAAYIVYVSSEKHPDNAKCFCLECATFCVLANEAILDVKLGSP